MKVWLISLVRFGYYKTGSVESNLTRSGEQRTTHVSIPLVKTEWNQHYPYNAQMPTNGKCSISYYYAGCIPIAVAQAITYYRKCRLLMIGMHLL